MRNHFLNGLILILLVLIMSDLAIAKLNQVYPKGCKPDAATFESHYIVLGTTPSDRQYRVFVFQNISSSEVMLEQAKEQNKLGIHTQSIIKPNRFSALLIEHNDFKLVCHDLVSNKPWPVPCNDVIRACELAVSPVMESAQGQYWITENRRSQNTLFSELRGHGIFP